jgi:type VI secretion system protein ImpJ
MPQLLPVLWTKGVLLSPQHLQTQDRFLEDLLAVQLATLVHQPWGFAELALDHAALAAGQVVVTTATGLFPDGLPFAIPQADEAPAPRSLDGCWAPDQERLLVSLGVPERRTGGHNVSTGAGAPEPTRWRAEVLLRRDENTGLAERPIQVARRNLRLLVEGESMEGHALLPLAAVRRTAGGYQYEPSFVPPVVDIGASDHLMGIARRLVERLAAKSDSLAGSRRQRNQGLADFGVSDVANFWLLHTVNTHLPVLRHLFETRRGHPAHLYEAMLALAGALTTFSTAIRPRELPAYDHDAPSACFGTLDEQIRRLLETVVPAHCVSLPLARSQPTIYATALEQDRYLDATQVYLAVRAALSQPELIAGVPRSAKVGSGHDIERLVRQALPGLPLAHVPVPPSAVPVKVDYQYFRVDRTTPGWDAVARARSLAVHLPAEFAEPQLELVLVLPKG